MTLAALHARREVVGAADGMAADDWHPSTLRVERQVAPGADIVSERP